jgi:hypothetical protein
MTALGAPTSPRNSASNRPSYDKGSRRRTQGVWLGLGLLVVLAVAYALSFGSGLDLQEESGGSGKLRKGFDKDDEDRPEWQSIAGVRLQRLSLPRSS